MGKNLWNYCWWLKSQTPVEVGFFSSHYLQGFTTIPGGWQWDFWLPSTVPPRSTYCGPVWEPSDAWTVWPSCMFVCIHIWWTNVIVVFFTTSLFGKNRNIFISKRKDSNLHSGFCYHQVISEALKNPSDGVATIRPKFGLPQWERKVLLVFFFKGMLVCLTYFQIRTHIGTSSNWSMACPPKFLRCELLSWQKCMNKAKL